MSTCTRCKREYEPESNDIHGICLPCRVVDFLETTQSYMRSTGNLMVRMGGPAEEHGRQMLGAARMINSWLDGLSDTTGESK